MAKPYLHQDHLNGVWFTNDEKIHNGFCSYDKAKNGFVCFECDCKEAFDWNKVPNVNEAYSLLERACVSDEDFLKYKGKRKEMFFYHFENVKPIDPMPITQLYKDEACTIPLTKAPQSYCFAYRKKYVKDPTGLTDYAKCGHKTKISDVYWIPEKCLVFSIRSPWCCKYGNGKKDLEVRT